VTTAVFFHSSEIDPLKSLNEIIPDLKQILFWMSNALEMLHFLQDNLSTYLPGAFHVNSSANDPEEEALANADEELLNVLEEVAMFTFQQTVYHLTKVCCSCFSVIKNFSFYSRVYFLLST
jgi:hypothetical protein